MHVSINHTGWKEYNKKFRRPLNYRTGKNPSNYKILWLLLPLVLLCPCHYLYRHCGKYLRKESQEMIMKAKTWIKTYVFTFYSNFHIYIIKFWKPYIKSPHQEYNQKKKKSLKEQGLLCYCYNKNFKEAVWNTDCVKKSGEIQKSNLGYQLLKSLSMSIITVSIVFYKSLI